MSPPWFLLTNQNPRKLSLPVERWGLRTCSRAHRGRTSSEGGADEDLGAARRSTIRRGAHPCPPAPLPRSPSSLLHVIHLPARLQAQGWAPSLGKSLGLHTHWPLCPERCSVPVLAKPPHHTPPHTHSEDSRVSFLGGFGPQIRVPGGGFCIAVGKNTPQTV